MGYWAAIAAAVSAAGSVVSSKQSSKTPGALPQNYYNIYGELNTPNAGAIASRDNIFSRINDRGFQDNIAGASNTYANALSGAAKDPGIASIYNFGRKTLDGGYLSSPLVRDYANQAYSSQLAAGSDQAAQTRARYARAGLGFSTANQQAQDADMASAAGRASLSRAGLLAQNYQSERQLQQAAPGMVSGAIGQPLSYLSQIPGAYYSPLQMQSGLTTQLAGGSSNIVKPDFYQNPTANDTLAAGVQNAQGLFSLLNTLKKASSTSSSSKSPVLGGDDSYP